MRIVAKSVWSVIAIHLGQSANRLFQCCRQRVADGACYNKFAVTAWTGGWWQNQGIAGGFPRGTPSAVGALQVDWGGVW